MDISEAISRELNRKVVVVCTRFQGDGFDWTSKRPQVAFEVPEEGKLVQCVAFGEVLRRETRTPRMRRRPAR
jgi:hypothetical protein